MRQGLFMRPGAHGAFLRPYHQSKGLEVKFAAGKIQDMGQERTSVLQIARILNRESAAVPEKGGNSNDPRTFDEAKGSGQSSGGVPIHGVPLVLGRQAQGCQDHRGYGEDPGERSQG